MEGGKPLMQVLKARQSGREFSPEKLPPQVLSNLLWAAWGINRPDSGRRTAPSASNRQEIEIYVATAEGLYLYDAKTHRLQPVLAKDIRADTGFIGQNVYLYCASEGLVTVVRGMVDRPALAKAMNLRPDQRITLAQTEGYPKK